MASDLKQRTKVALLWNSADKAVQIVLGVIQFYFTARWIPEYDWGLAATLTVFTAVAMTLSEGGLSVALIRKPNMTQEDCNNMFLFNLLISSAIFLVLFAAAPSIAAYNRAPELTRIARVEFAVIIIYALSFIQSSLLIRRMDFRRLAFTHIFSALMGFAVCLVLASKGFGVWALVANLLTSAVVRTLLFWGLDNWKPSWKFDYPAFREMFGFSSKLLAGDLLRTFSTNFYGSLLGRFIPIREVGYYGVADKIKNNGSTTLWSVFGMSTYSMLVNLQDDPYRLKNALRKTMRTMAFVTFPVMAGIAVVARPLLEVYASEKWLPSVSFLQILCVGGAVWIFNMMHSNVLKVNGRSDLTLRMEVVTAVLSVVFLFSTIRFGLVTALLADSVAKLIVYFIYMGINSRLTGYRVAEQLRDVLPYAALALTMAALVFSLKWYLLNPYLLFLSQVIVGGGFYAGVSRVFRSTELADAIGILRKTKTDR